MKFKSLLLTTILSFFTCLAYATPGTGGETKKADIAGGVFHATTRKPLPNVSVTAYSATKKEQVVLTNTNGNYSFEDLKSGTYKLIFEKNGYKKVIKEKVTIRSDEGSQLNIEMGEHSEFIIMPGLLFSDGD